LLWFCVALGSPAAAADEKFIVLASTTSTEQSGLFGHLLPLFKQATDIDVHVVAVGTGQALDIARRGDADAVLVHDQPAEEKFVAEGFSLQRRPVMYNDFVLIGPRNDPAHVKGSEIAGAMAKLAKDSAPFVSRGDKSGTHSAELRLWKQAGVNLETAKPVGYKECGCGMGPALNMATSLNAYLLADRGTWLAFKNKGPLVVAVEGDPSLLNRYDLIELNPKTHSGAKLDAAHRLAEWLAGPEGQKAIGAYQVGGEQLFHPSAATPR
jgi:tungstate transport system substrate-binding protein